MNLARDERVRTGFLREAQEIKRGVGPSAIRRKAPKALTSGSKFWTRGLKVNRARNPAGVIPDGLDKAGQDSAARGLHRGRRSFLLKRNYGPQTDVYLPLKSCQTPQRGAGATAIGAPAIAATGAVAAPARPPATTKGAAAIWPIGPMTGGP